MLLASFALSAGWGCEEPKNVGKKAPEKSPVKSGYLADPTGITAMLKEKYPDGLVVAIRVDETSASATLPSEAEGDPEPWIFSIDDVDFSLIPAMCDETSKSVSVDAQFSIRRVGIRRGGPRDPIRFTVDTEYKESRVFDHRGKRVH